MNLQITSFYFIVFLCILYRQYFALTFKSINHLLTLASNVTLTSSFVPNDDDLTTDPSWHVHELNPSPRADPKVEDKGHQVDDAAVRASATEKGLDVS